MRRSVFWLRYFVKNVLLAVKLLLRGDAGRVFSSVYARIFRGFYSFVFRVRAPFLRGASPATSAGTLSIQTNHPVAFSSPDHVAPFGTMYDNSTNRKFVLRLNQIVGGRFKSGPRCFMDLGCSGGQLVADFLRIGWTAVGLEGSDYSLKHRRANWATLANKNLFTCDITKPFQVMSDQRPLRFHLITMWEVLEHIHGDDLPMLFENISKHLVEGGFFIASTASGSSIVDGVELHQTRWTNPEWQRFLADRIPSMIPADLGLKIHHYVRYDFGEPSFLVYQKREVPTSYPQRSKDEPVTQSRR
ncbi:MAG TPA: methyltransferase domain-containing protein [Verrucomicrobiae bacterium]|nr:methyltransferase domain-containing protein [Verrucomicrobiae bacterium]